MAGRFEDIGTGISYENFPKDPAAREAITIVNNKVEEIKGKTVIKQEIINLENKIKQSGYDNDNLIAGFKKEIEELDKKMDGIDGGNYEKIAELEEAVNGKAPRDLVDSLLGQIEGSVKQVNGVEPDENGHVTIDLDTEGLVTNEIFTEKTDELDLQVFNKAETTVVTDLATKVTKAEKQLADNPIKPEQFDGTDFEKLQQAFTLAITDKRAIFISKTYDIGAGTIDLSKVYSPRNPIRVFGGGTIKKSVAGFMFNSEIYASSDYYFDDIKFEGVPGVNVTVFDCSNTNIIRIYLDRCTFIRVKTGVYSNTYIQTVLMNKCLVTAVFGDFIDVNGAINCKFNTIIGEDCTGTFFNHRGVNDGTESGLRVLSNVSIKDSVLEGFSNPLKPVIFVKGAVGLVIDGNYFEANKGGHIVFDEQTTTYNVNISNNNHFGGVDAPALIKWGRDLLKCESNNNSSSVIPIHDTRAIMTGVILSKNDNSPIANLQTNAKFLHKLDENNLLTSKGTFVPTIYGTTTPGTNGYNTQYGTYVKHGNIVICDISIILTAKDAAMAGNLEIGGLPFTVKNQVGYYPSGIVSTYSNLTLSTGYTLLGARGKLGTKNIAIVQSGNANYRLPLPVSGIVFSSEIFIQLTYETTE